MAKRFRFRLEGVRKVRTQQRDARRRELAEAVRAVTRVEKRVAQLNGALRANVEQAREDRQVGRIDMVSVRGCQVHRNHLHHRLMESYAVLGERQGEVGARRAKLAEASRDLKVIEKLRDRQWARHCETLAREERAESDEVATQRFLRDRPGPGREDGP